MLAQEYMVKQNLHALYAFLMLVSVNYFPLVPFSHNLWPRGSSHALLSFGLFYEC